MKTIINKYILFIATVALILFQACEKPQPIVEGNNQYDNGEAKFDSQLFKENVIAGMGEEWAGYQLVINIEGLLDQEFYFGKSITGNDGNVDQFPWVSMYIGSISKFITAVAVLQALDKYQGGAASKLNSSIAPYLPDDWAIGPNVASVSFKELMLHQTGLASNAPIDYGSLKTIVKNGFPANQSYNYSNANYALLRIILPILTGDINSVSGASDVQMQDKTISLFKRYIDTQIFEPNSIDAYTKPSGIDKALYYKYPDLPNTGGWEMGDMTDRLGNGGWFMSASNVARFLAFLNETEDILNSETRELLYNNFLGLSDLTLPNNTPSGDHGIYYTKGGSFQNNGRGVRSIVAIFPETHTEIVIIANSRGGKMDGTSGIRQMVFKAYDDAWVVKN